MKIKILAVLLFSMIAFFNSTTPTTAQSVMQSVMDDPSVWGPLLLAGDGWKTTVTLKNENGNPQKVRIAAKYGMGWILPIDYAAPQEFVIGGKGDTILTYASSGKMQRGYVQVDGGCYFTKDCPFSGISGTVILENSNTGEYFEIPLLRPSKSTKLSVEFEKDHVDTGLVVLNPPQVPMNTGGVVTFWLYDEYDRLVAAAIRVKHGAGTQKSFFLGQLFAENPDFEEWTAKGARTGALLVSHHFGLVAASAIYRF